MRGGGIITSCTVHSSVHYADVYARYVRASPTADGIRHPIPCRILHVGVLPLLSSINIRDVKAKTNNINLIRERLSLVVHVHAYTPFHALFKVSLHAPTQIIQYNLWARLLPRIMYNLYRCVSIKKTKHIRTRHVHSRRYVCL